MLYYLRFLRCTDECVVTHVVNEFVVMKPDYYNGLLVRFALYRPM